MSSDFEGFPPNSLVEAMAVGLPVISTDFPTGIARDLIGEDNGRIVPVNDRNALGNAIIEIMSNSQLRKKMRIENRKIANDLNLEKIVCKWESIF
ncbi:alpha-1,4-N-acetylgalactosamine transferase PglH [Gracilibacillus boraciitolerans JCM 21714]|uniref:Alpha-1,4-N-acetylgalactosamine transferase PglH n=2 Tax=Gracilibacillus boraciitolerans TaxID=307521 RepID=W4VPT5_9BACI|nr:alpha-1,4-N-acetylgalactosamine transferase PglH [Gracilibacillus boraciitolerans JCM 21714]